jgi:hypothetical protein
MYSNVFIVYLNISECIYNIFEYIWIYLNIFGYIWIYLDIFECTYSIFMVYFNIFQCVWKYLNVFIDIIIGISPSYSHCNVFTMCTHIHICFSLSTMTTFLSCYITTFFSPIPINLFQLSYNLWKNYISSFHFMSINHPAFHIPHSMSSLVVRRIVEPKFYSKFLKEHLLKHIKIIENILNSKLWYNWLKLWDLWKTQLAHIILLKIIFIFISW